MIELENLTLSMAVTGSDDGAKRTKEQVRAAVAELRGRYRALLEGLKRESYGKRE